MGARRWTVALDGYLIPIGGGREREVYDDGEQVVLADDHDRIVAEAEARGWNAAVEAGVAGLRALPASRMYDPWEDDFATPERFIPRQHALDAIAALRKPEVEG